MVYDKCFSIHNDAQNVIMQYVLNSSFLTMRRSVPKCTENIVLTIIVDTIYSNILIK